MGTVRHDHVGADHFDTRDHLREYSFAASSCCADEFGACEGGAFSDKEKSGEEIKKMLLTTSLLRDSMSGS